MAQIRWNGAHLQGLESPPKPAVLKSELLGMQAIHVSHVLKLFLKQDR